MGNLEIGLKVIMIVIAVALTTLFFIFVENAATQSHLLSIKKISVSGNVGLSKDEIIEQAGVMIENNILALNLDHVKAGLISHPWITDASVKRRLPDELDISIREERAMAVVQMDGVADILINFKGEPFSENDGIGNKIYGTRNIEHSSNPLPVITGLKLTMDPEKRYRFEGRLHGCVMDLLNMEKEEEIQTISADLETGIEIKAVINQNLLPGQDPEQPIRVKLGFDNFKENFKKIRHIVKYMQQNSHNKQICSIDLINPENIVIQIKDGDALPESQQGGV